MQFTIFIILAPIATVICFAVAYYAYHHRNTTGAMNLFLYIACVTGYLIGNFLELISPVEADKLLFAKFSYLFLEFLAVTWLAFAFQFTGLSRWSNFKRFWPFIILPVLTNVFVHTNELHGLIWQHYTFVPVGNGFLWMQVDKYGTWFWVQGVYMYALLILGSVLIGRYAFSPSLLHRRQSFWMIVGALTPLIANFIYVFKMIPGLMKDFTPLSFALAGLAFAMGMFKYRLFDLMPIARENVIDKMRDGVIVLDRSNEVVDFNPAASKILNLAQLNGIGQPFGQLVPNWVEMISHPNEDQTHPVEIAIPDGKISRVYELQINPLKLQGEQVDGRIILLHDVTENRIARETLAHVNEQLEERIRTRTRALTQRAAELEAITSISTVLRKAVTLEDMLPILLKEIVTALSADAGAILLLGENCLDVILAKGFKSDVAGMTILPCADMFWQALSQERPIVYNAGQSDHSLCQSCQVLLDGMNTAMVVQLRSAANTLGVMVVAYKQSRRLSGEHFRLMTAIAEMGGNAIQRVQVMATLEKLVADRTRDLSTLYELTAISNEYLGMDEVLNRILEKVFHVLGCRAGLLHLYDEEERQYRLVKQRGLTTDLDLLIRNRYHPRALWENVIQNNQIMVSPDLITASPYFQSKIGEDEPVYVGLPVHAHGSLLGAFCIYTESFQKYSAEDLALLTAIADHIGNTVESIKLREQAEVAAVMEERQRLARELHDSVTQLLYSLILFSDAGQESTRSGNQQHADHMLRRMSETSRQALREMRLLIYELRPLALQQVGLVEALRQRLEAVEKRAGLEAELQTHLHVELPPDLEAGLYRIAQEALNNIIKHSTATHVEVELIATRADVQLKITDNGMGFEPDIATNSGGIGLSSMRERIEKLGGELQLDSKPQHGTTILARINYLEPVASALNIGSKEVQP